MPRRPSTTGTARFGGSVSCPGCWRLAQEMWAWRAMPPGMAHGGGVSAMEFEGRWNPGVPSEGEIWKPAGISSHPWSEPCFENWDLCSCLKARSCSTMLTRAPSMAVALGRGKREPMAVGSETDLGFDFLSSIPGTCGWRWPSSLGVFQSPDVRGPVSTSRCLTCAGTAKVFNLCPCASFHAMSILWDLGSRHSRPTPCQTLPRRFSSWL